MSDRLRTQYHFRPSSNGFYAWDVSRLVRLSRDFEVVDVPLSAINELDENYWFGAPGDIPSCRQIVAHIKMINEVDLAFPIILCSRGRIMDGMHRVGKALLYGNETIRAVKFARDPQPDYEDVYPEDLPY